MKKAIGFESLEQIEWHLKNMYGMGWKYDRPLRKTDKPKIVKVRGNKIDVGLGPK